MLGMKLDCFSCSLLFLFGVEPLMLPLLLYNARNVIPDGDDAAHSQYFDHADMKSSSSILRST
jgi:hypothetical protein